jgi:hypothetical protein
MEGFTMTENVVTVIDYRGSRYGIVTSGNRIGICRNGFGRVKYMPVVFNYGFHFLPKLLKTRLLLSTSAQDLAETLISNARLGAFVPESVAVCEHILQNGHTPR